MGATIEVDGGGQRTFSGHVGFISSVAEFTPRSIQTTELRTSLVYEVRVLVDDPNDVLRLGMPATVHLHEDGSGAGS
jgi:HlyD family secretion protein